MTETTKTQRPNVIIPIILCIVVALLLLAFAGFLLIMLNTALTDNGPCCGSGTFMFPDELASFTQYLKVTLPVLFSVAVLHLLVALLLRLYKRIGLILGVILFGIDVLFIIYSDASGRGVNLISVLSILLGLVGLFYALIYLIREPARSFFK